MSGFYQYDTRGASAADQIVNLERMVEERDAEIKRLRGLLREAPKHPMTESLRRRVREALGE